MHYLIIMTLGLIARSYKTFTRVQMNTHPYEMHGCNTFSVIFAIYDLRTPRLALCSNMEKQCSHMQITLKAEKSVQ